MKAVILAGGRGTRISEESHLRPKPMIEIGGRPILWHIMKIYAAHGVTDFVICLGYRGYMIKEYFANFRLHSADVTIDFKNDQITFHDVRTEPWSVTLVDTGDETMTGGRLKRVMPYLDEGEHFCVTYGDGVADVDISSEIRFHRQHGMLATMTVVRPPARFGNTLLEADRVVAFEEKAQARSGFINGGFFVLSWPMLDLIEGDATTFEAEPLERAAALGQLAAWRHEGFWQPMDTLREKEALEAMWEEKAAPWRIWG